jgi:autotransporter-associated beta strand protein
MTKGAQASTTTNSAGTTSTLTLNVAGTSTYAGNLRGDLQLTLGGAGTCTLSGTNTYTGATAVNNGTLFVNGINSGAGAITVASGAKLGGNGIIAGPVTVQSGSTLIPGTSIGTLTVTNTVTLSAGSTTVMEISRNTGTPTFDLLTGVTTLNYGGSLIVTNIGTSTLRSGDVYNLFDATTFNPGFSSITVPALLPGLFWNTNLTVDGTMSVGGTAIPPQFSPTGLSGSLLSFSGTGGLAGVRYVVLTSTNVALPVINWNPIATNTFGGGGTFNFTDTVSSTAVPGRFYMIAIP